MRRATRQAPRPPTPRSRRAAVGPHDGGGGLRIPWIPLVVLAGIVAVFGVVAYLVIHTGTSGTDPFANARRMEEDPAPKLPGQYVDLTKAFADGSMLAHYGATNGPNTAAHVTQAVDYSKEGLPPAGGPHWGSTTCGPDPKTAPPLCGPAPWGIYRDPWHPETLIHNMEHGGVVVWYNTTSSNIRDQIEAEAKARLDAGGLVVVTPYAALPPETVALTAWARRDEFPVRQLDVTRMDTFITTFSCRFNPQGFTCSSK